MRFFESTLERDLHTLLTADPDIVRFAIQPHRLTYWCEEPGTWPVKRQYVPDVVAQTQSGECLIFEAKSATFAEDRSWQAREPFIRKAYREDHGLEMVLLTEAEIRSQPRLANCQQLLQHRPFVADEETPILVRKAIEQASLPATISAILEGAKAAGADDTRAYSVVMQMITSGELQFSHDQPISPDCKVSQ